MQSHWKFKTNQNDNLFSLQPPPIDGAACPAAAAAAGF